jgi:hypothetical protein
MLAALSRDRYAKRSKSDVRSSIANIVLISFAGSGRDYSVIDSEIYGGAVLEPRLLTRETGVSTKKAGCGSGVLSGDGLWQA